MWVPLRRTRAATSAYAKAAAINAAGLAGFDSHAATSVTDTAAFASIVEPRPVQTQT